MNDKGKWRRCFISVVQFVAAMAIVLWPAGGWAQSDNQAVFTPAISQKVEARSEPAKVTTEDESALKSKGYVKIGRVKASQPGEKTNAEITEGLRAVALSKAAGAGGDVVHFEREGPMDITEVPTGKTKRECLDYQWVYVKPGPGTGGGMAHVCDSTGWVPVTKTVTRVVSEGTVWRYDPNLAAEIRRAEAAAVKEAVAKAGPDARDKDGWTQLHHAAFSGNQELAELLLDNGADVNAGTPTFTSIDGIHLAKGTTPLLLALGKDDDSLAKMLLMRGAKADQRDDDGVTPLHMAAHKKDPDLVKLLVSHGANVDPQDKDGMTPLMWAASHPNPEAVKALLALGANKSLRDRFGRTALDNAKTVKYDKQKYNEIRQLLSP